MIGIYKITNQLNNKSYIGQSIHIEQRWQEHLYQSSQCSLIKYALHKYGVNNFSFEILEECSQEKLNEREQYWINYYDSFNNGYNLTLGGDGAILYSVEAVYEDYLKTNSIKQTSKNIGCHENTARRILREYGIDKNELQQAKSIEQIEPTTLQSIKVYSSIQEAADAMGVDHNAIRYAVEGIHQTSCGYYWKYTNEDKSFTPTDKIKQWKTKVIQIDSKTGKQLNTFESAADAAAFLGKDRKNGGSQITAVCNGRKKTAYGFIWKKI